MDLSKEFISLSSSVEANKSDKDTPRALAMRSKVFTEGSVLPPSIRLYCAVSNFALTVTSF